MEGVTGVCHPFEKWSIHGPLTGWLSIDRAVDATCLDMGTANVKAAPVHHGPLGKYLERTVTGGDFVYSSVCGKHLYLSGYL